MANLAQFEKQNYLNIETFRKTGVGVKTPIWFAMDGEGFYMITDAHSGKFKRIRNNPRVRVSPCKYNGEVNGEWIDGRAEIVADGALQKRIDHMLNQKYGLVKRLFELTAMFRTKGVKSYLHVTPV